MPVLRSGALDRPTVGAIRKKRTARINHPKPVVEVSKAAAPAEVSVIVIDSSDDDEEEEPVERRMSADKLAGGGEEEEGSTAPIPKKVGVTPEGVEIPWILVDEKLQEKELNSEPVISEGFPEWKEIMDLWGFKMVSAIEVVAEMAAIGFGLPEDAFTSLMKQGPHLLAPTGSDLQRHGSEGTVFAGYHYDLNFLTIHGRSRFPSLNIWLRNGQKVEVKVLVGCLLIQSGKQLEWLIGGGRLTGMHEVVVPKRTLDAIELARLKNHSMWRVSSTITE